ncbi:hypothetical protein Fmac_024984 [Flemingia macrophylla]|uniref:Uncharacterized protein n=1 Tax=Flemingia macrophylla TaxID=520843 RepID=A0ABD1LR19_9FABA
MLERAFQAPENLGTLEIRVFPTSTSARHRIIFYRPDETLALPTIAPDGRSRVEKGRVLAKGTPKIKSVNGRRKVKTLKSLKPNMHEEDRVERVMVTQLKSVKDKQGRKRLPQGAVGLTGNLFKNLIANSWERVRILKIFLVKAHPPIPLSTKQINWHPPMCDFVKCNTDGRAQDCPGHAADENRLGQLQSEIQIVRHFKKLYVISRFPPSLCCAFLAQFCLLHGFPRGRYALFVHPCMVLHEGYVRYVICA